MKSKLILAILALALLGGGYGYYLFNKKTPGLENAKADFMVNANELFDAFDSNEQEAQSTYGSKVVEVTGEVLEVKQSDTQTTIILKAENALIGGINCSFSKIIEAPGVGEEITIRGLCQGFLMDVILNNCTIVK